ncbi:hypothetical protein BJF78_33740 [Pseudonocardia sp. CNS-139]|nr:hypothetical protein BJF78_33740 [Pseudonocardia sp. CNS-139]
MIDELAVFIAAETGMADRILAAHVPDVRGRCCGCPNSSTGNMPWPCALRAAAVGAQTRRLIERGRP